MDMEAYIDPVPPKKQKGVPGNRSKVKIEEAIEILSSMYAELKLEE